MNQRERLARIKSKVNHPSQNVDHTFRMMTDTLTEVASVEKTLVPLFEVTPTVRDRHRAWSDNLKMQYRTGVLN